MEKDNLKTITKQGHKDLKNKLKNLIEVSRPNVIKEIAEARSHGDLSENAEYHAAREMQGKIESEILEIENILDTVKIVTKKTNPSKNTNQKEEISIVDVGSIIEFKNMNTKKTEQYKIVSEYEIDPIDNRISNQCLVVKEINRNIEDFKDGKIIKINSPISYKIKDGKIL